VHATSPPTCWHTPAPQSRRPLTTPNRWFPLELHTRLPLVHWLPAGVAGRAYDLAGKSWARENHLLGSGELRGLFPGPVHVHNLGMTLVAIA